MAGGAQTGINAAINKITPMPGSGIEGAEVIDRTGTPTVEQTSGNPLDGQTKSNYDVQKEVDLNGREEAYGWKSEDRRSFLGRVHEGARTSGEVGAIAYAYDPVGPFDTSRSAEETAQELTTLGIKSFYHNGLEWNDGRKTFIDRGDAATIGTEIVGISRKAFGDGKEIAGHEALHKWYFTDAGKRFVSEFKANRLMDTPYAIEQALKVMENYSTDGNVTDKALFAEEFIARIGGQIHSGKHDNNLRTMFKDFNAVKQAWQNLVHENAPNYQFAAENTTAVTPVPGSPADTARSEQNISPELLDARGNVVGPESSVGAAAARFSMGEYGGTEQTSKMLERNPYGKYQAEATGLTKEEYENIYKYTSQTEKATQYLADLELYMGAPSTGRSRKPNTPNNNTNQHIRSSLLRPSSHLRRRPP